MGDLASGISAQLKKGIGGQDTTAPVAALSEAGSATMRDRDVRLEERDRPHLLSSRVLSMGVPYVSPASSLRPGKGNGQRSGQSVMMDKASGRSRGFGFVNFTDEATMEAVLTVPHQVDGVAITCSRYSKRPPAARCRPGSRCSTRSTPR